MSSHRQFAHGKTSRLWHGNSEIRRFRAFPAMLGVVLLIPLFYGGIFLWSMWNPVDNVNNMPVAVVNQDQGAETTEQQPLNAGQKIVDNLHNNDRVDWQFVSQEEASEGLTQGRYFVTVTIPPDFSSAVTSIGTETPRRGLLEVNYNDASGATARQIVERIVQNLRDSVSSSIGSQAADKVFGSIDQISEGVGKAANGSGQINDGAQRLNASVRDELAPGANKLKNSVQNELAPGAKKLSDGINDQLLPGVTRLNSSVRDELAPGASKLADGNRQLANGMQQLNDSVAVLRDNPAAMSIPKVRELVDGVEKLNNGAGQAAAGAEKLSDGINQQLLPGTEQLQASVSTSLAPGAKKLSDGINDQLVPGVGKLADGISTQLADGTGKLAAGTSELNNGLNDASGQIPRYNAEQAQNNGSVIVSPVGVNENWVYQQKNNGEGMAPYFAALALFIGAIFTWQALRPLSRRALVARVSAFRALMHSLAPGLLLSTIQAVLLVTVATLIFHLPVSRWVPAFAILLLAGWMFTALQQMFAILLGNAPGRLLSIIFLLVNLGSAGGTYPLQTLPDGLRFIGPVLPFYHVVQGLREALIGSIGSDYWGALAYLGVGLIVCVAISMFGASQRKVFTMRQLRPVIPTA